MSRVKPHPHPYIFLPQKFEHSACLVGFAELPEALSRYTDWALLRNQGSRGAGSSWRTSSQQGGVSEELSLEEATTLLKSEPWACCGRDTLYHH